MGFLIRLAAFASFVGAAFYTGLMLAYRFGAVDFGKAFGMTFTISLPLLIIGGVTLLLGLVGLIAKRPGSGLVACVAAALAIACGTAPVMIKNKAGQVPPIHDITTDTQNPPQFVEVVPLRNADNAPNPPEYDTGQTAQQLEAYPELVTMSLSVPYDEAFDASVATLREMGLELVDMDRGAGRIEATHTSLWWGFKDDMVIRFNRNGEMLSVDVRSKSRMGGSDLGANAARIERFLGGLQDRLAA